MIRGCFEFILLVFTIILLLSFMDRIFSTGYLRPHHIIPFSLAIPSFASLPVLSISTLLHHYRFYERTFGWANHEYLALLRILTISPFALRLDIKKKLFIPLNYSKPIAVLLFSTLPFFIPSNYINNSNYLTYDAFTIYRLLKIPYRCVLYDFYLIQ